jgi:hypothetical protein
LILLAVAADSVLLNRLRAFWARRLQADSSPVQREAQESHAA